LEEVIMNIFNTDLITKVNILKAALDKTEALIIGVGAGLSSTAGLAYGNADTFNTTFPGYYDRYGLQSINEADFYQFSTPKVFCSN
jgi:NAD-dependent SIR2 family protein deacetylase